MKFRKSKDLDSEYYARSQEGVWIRSELTDEGVELFWQVRTRVDGNKVLVYDANGNIEKEMERHKAAYPPSMKSAGIIPIDDDFVEFCGEGKYEDAVWAVMRHSAHMVAAGYGETPEHIVDLMSKIWERDFINGVSYKFEKGCPPFEDLVGLEGVVEIGDDDSVKLTVRALGEDYSVPIETDNDLVSFMVSSVPI